MKHKKSIAVIAYLLLFTSCVGDLDYDISSVVEIPVLSALWTADASQHEVYLCTSGPYEIKEAEEDITIQCYVNGVLKEEKNEYETINDPYSKIILHKYLMNVGLVGGDHVKLIALIGDKKMEAEANVPSAPMVKIDTSSFQDYASAVYHNYRIYDVTLTVKDEPGKENFYRLFSPTVFTEAWDDETGEKRSESGGKYVQIDDKDPIFKNIDLVFPKEITLELPFLSHAISNDTHIFSDELFSDEEYQFHFQIAQGSYLPYPVDDGDPLTYRVRFRLAQLSKEEYLYLVAANAAASAILDPFAEPVIMPSNIVGGLGVFCIRNGTDEVISLKPGRF